MEASRRKSKGKNNGGTHKERTENGRRGTGMKRGNSPVVKRNNRKGVEQHTGKRGKVRRRHWKCLRVFPQAIAEHIGNGMAAKTNGKRKETQVDARLFILNSRIHTSFVFGSAWEALSVLITLKQRGVDISHNAYRSFNLKNISTCCPRTREGYLTIIFNVLVSKWAFLSRFMETLLTYEWTLAFSQFQTTGKNGV